MVNAFRCGWIAAVAVALVLVGLDTAAQGVYRQVDEKGKVIYSDVPQERVGKPAAAQPTQAGAAQARPAQTPQQVQPQTQAGSGTRYQPTGPVVDYTGRYSQPEPFGFKTSGKTGRPMHQEKSLDERIAEQNARQSTQEREAQLRDQARRDKAIEQDRMRVEREAKLRLENDKRKLRELSRENDRR